MSTRPSDASNSTDIGVEWLSSGLTFFMKVVFPAVWILGWGAAALAAWNGASVHDRDGAVVDDSTWFMLFGWIVGTTFLGWGCVRLKGVGLAGETLVISNFHREIAVPVADIESVSSLRWINPEPVTIRFRRTTAFGDSIVFMPTWRLFGYFSEHPVVKRLEDLAAEPRSERSAGH